MYGVHSELTYTLTQDRVYIVLLSTSYLNINYLNKRRYILLIYSLGGVISYICISKQHHGWMYGCYLNTIYTSYYLLSNMHTGSSLC